MARTKVLSHKKGLNVWEPDTEPAGPALKEQVKKSHGWVREQDEVKGHENSACPNKAHAAYSKWMRDMELMWLCVWIHVCEGCMCTLWKLGVNPEYCCSEIVFWDRSLTGDHQFCQAVWVICFRDLPASYSPALRLQMHMPTPAFLHGAWG